MRNSFLPTAILTLPLLVACSGKSDDGISPGGSGGSTSSGGTSVGGNGGSGASGGGSGGGSGGSSTVTKTFCERWHELGPGDLPGFATDSECHDFTDIAINDAPCSGADNASAVIETVQLAQNHLLDPTSEDYTENEDGEALNQESIRPKFRLISHRPALLMVAVTGAGAAPEVRVTARRNGSELGSLCLRGPDTLSDSVSAEPNFDDRFTLSLPADWVRSGLELEIQAGGATRQIPSTDLRVAGGLRHIVVEGAMQMYGDTELHFVPKNDPNPYVQADEFPAQSVVWSHFPVPIVLDPMTMSPREGNPPRIVPAHEGSFDEVGECLDIFNDIRHANGHQWESAWYGSMRAGGPNGWGGGLGGHNIGAAGPATQLMIRHELGHHYGLPHMEEGYFQKRYPFARRADGSGCEHNVEGQDGCGVGPFWKYFQTRATFQTPWEDEGTGTYKREPMAGGGDNWFGAYTDQWLLDYMQNRLYWDDEQGAYVRYDAETGEFVIDEGDPDNWYERPEQRDVPVYTLFGSYSDTVEEVRVIQPPLHYRGHLRRVMDPTNPEHIQWLKDNPGKVCNGGCDFAIRAIFEGGVERNFLINRSSSQFVRWAINVPDEGKLTRSELYRRDLRNGGGGNIASIDAATYFDDATLVASRDF